MSVIFREGLRVGLVSQPSIFHRCSVSYGLFLNFVTTFFSADFTTEQAREDANSAHLLLTVNNLNVQPRSIPESKYQETIRNDFVEFLVDCQRDGKRVVGYGAPGKGNTLLNHCGIRSDLIEFTVDRNPHKHGMFLPGTHIPIHPVERLAEERPHYVVIMPWNLRAEITEQLDYIRNWGGQFVVSLPRLEVF